jgi:hypothetical protein
VRVPDGTAPADDRKRSPVTPARSLARTGPMLPVPSATPAAFWNVAVSVALSSWLE